ncbi:MAG: PorV/PorQ family protein [Elusimicrobiales bacterium]|nr:PorV/PorQ family protein [Elusimicrobiales bacterium]
MNILLLTTILILNLKLSGLDILKNDFNALVVGMAGSNAAIEEGISALNYNPAGLAFGKKFETSLSLSNGFEDASYSYISTAIEIPYKILSEFSTPHCGMSIYFSNLGNMKIRTIDNSGNITEKNTSAEKDTIITFGYAEKLTEQTIYISPSTKSKFEGAAGISLKYINSTLLSKYSANSLAADVGYIGKLTDVGITFGLSLSNSLGKIKYYKEEYKLPTIFRIATSYSRPTILENKTTISIEYDSYLTDKKQSLKLGIDYTIEDIFSFRTGYRFFDDNKGLTLGIGLYTHNFSFDIATTFTSVYKYSIFSVTYRLGNFQDKPTPKKSPQLEKFKEKNREKTPPLPSTNKEKTIIVF